MASVAPLPQRGRDAGRAADARPQALRAEIRLDRGQPDEADEHRQRRSGRRATPTLHRNHGLLQEYIAMLTHHRLPIGMTGTDASFSERQLDDRDSRSSRPSGRSSSRPTERSRSAPTRRSPPGMRRRLNVIRCRRAASPCVRTCEDEDEQERRDDQHQPADGRHRHGPRLRFERRMACSRSRPCAAACRAGRPVPRQRQHQHADEPQPELQPS